MHGTLNEAATRGPAARQGGWLRRVAREPLTHFVLIGAAIFAAAHYIEQRTSRYRIDVGSAELRRIANAYAQQYGTAPSPAELKAMTGDYVRQEILLREGKALGLDKDDEIVRRRIAQKFEFLLSDRVASGEPSQAQLQTWFAQHRARYSIPPRRSFDHLYFAADQRGDRAARDLAQQALGALRAGKSAPAEDLFPGPGVIRLLSQADTERLFGGDGFAASVFAAPSGQWSGPYRSGFGWHLVRVTESQPARTRDFAEVRSQVLADWQEGDRKARNQAAYDEIRARYTLDLPEAVR